MKRNIKHIMCAVLVALMCFTLTSCYVSHPAKMAKLVGTYAIKTFTRKDANASSDTDPTDLIKENGVVAYLVVADNGYGYYVYKDNETPLTVNRVTITYAYDEEDLSKVKTITYTDGLPHTGDKYPGSGSELLGLNFRLFTKELNYSHGTAFKQKYSQSVVYKKVNNATDLSFVQKKLGSLPEVIDNTQTQTGQAQ